MLCCNCIQPELFNEISESLQLELNSCPVALLPNQATSGKNQLKAAKFSIAAKAKHSTISISEMEVTQHVKTELDVKAAND
jgi:S-methylmethionine-dependent homocysteine/selenocysteine methylase